MYGKICNFNLKELAKTSNLSRVADAMREKGKNPAKRAKTFTGCWTCRTRKVKCDLGRPSCQRCEKSGFECGGYDIKLRWSQPISFDSFGHQTRNEGANVGGGGGGSSAEEPQFQRRNVAFVRYQEEYEFYEEMDDELSALHSPGLDKIAEGRTWIIKKFGVFRGTDRVKKKYAPRKRRRQNLSGLVGKNGSGLKRGSPPVIVKEADPSIYGFQTAEEPKISDDSGSKISNLFDFDFSSIKLRGNEWISNELKEDALVSASAMRGASTDGLMMQLGLAPRVSGGGGGATSPPIANDLRLDSRNSTGRDPSLVDDCSHIYKLLNHKDVARNNATKSPFPDLNSSKSLKPSIVPLDNEILIDAPGGETTMPRDVLEVVPSEVPDITVFNRVDNDNLLLRIPTTGLHVHGMTRFLLNYYLQNVVDLMTVVALPTNPWRTIYFPRALQALGDLAGIGYTSNSRNSLLNALLAVSCFNLLSKFPRNSPEMKFYLQMGINFRGQASRFLKLCLEATIKQERYKDILTSILSMNSIDVVWGTMADCQYHLSLCENIVEDRMKVRPQISSKAKSLHRIFSFLKLIQDSTALDTVTAKEIVISDEEIDKDGATPCEGEDGEFKEAIDQVDGKIKIQFVKQSISAGSTPIFSDIASQTYYYPRKKLNSNDILSTDALYGLPNSIILLLSDCVRLARHREYFRSRSMPLPRTYNDICSRLDSRLMSWSSEWDFRRPNSDEFISDTLEGVYHHTMSFYYSLIIYHRTMAAEGGLSTLQGYVRKVLTHLNKLTTLIDEKNVKIVPLIWQGFIAGCASVDSDLQIQFKNWAAKLANSGMGSYWGARQVMFEVWRRRMNGETSDSWYAVYRSWEMNLMLT